MRSILTLMGVAALAGCAALASSEPPETPLPDGSYKVSGVMGGQNLDGTLEVAGETVTLRSNRGTCITWVDYGANRGRVLRTRSLVMNCEGAESGQQGMRVGLRWDLSGKLQAHGSVARTEMVRRRGECMRWSTDNARRCLEYAWTTEPVTHWDSGSLTVFRNEQGG